jgi:hypothetical protein
MPKKVNKDTMYFLLKPRKRTTFRGKKYSTRKKYRGQGR